MSLSQCSGSCSVFRRTFILLIYTFNFMSGWATVSENNKHADRYHQKIIQDTKADKHVYVNKHL
ncbi:hypothetical protein BT93_E2168 [Corymbia citriodora subsp. variegata]|nr:hypothetical protein BT93_E2168 [Corymbia citriodora subsp. variegata]